MSNKGALLGGIDWEESTDSTTSDIISTNIDVSSFFTDVPVEETSQETQLNKTIEEQPEKSTEEVITQVEETIEETEQVVVEDDKPITTSFNELVNSLVDKGILNVSEELEVEDSLEGLSSLIDKEKESYFNSKVNSLSESTKKLIELELKGIEPNDVLEDFINYKEIDLEDIDNQENLLKEFYIKTGIYQEEDENLDTKIQNKLKNLDVVTLTETLEEAISFLENKQQLDLKQKEELALQKAELYKKEKELEDKKQYEEFKSKITSIREIKGLTVSQQEAEELFNYMTVKDSKGKTQAEKDQTEEAWLFLEYIKMKKIDLNSLNRKAITTATKQMEKKIFKIAPKGEVSNVQIPKEKESPIQGIPFNIHV